MSIKVKHKYCFAFINDLLLINFAQRYLLELIFSQFTVLSYFWAILMVIWTLYTNDKLQYFRSYLSIFYHYGSEEYVKLMKLLDVLPSKAKWASSHLYSNTVNILVWYIFILILDLSQGVPSIILITKN